MTLGQILTAIYSDLGYGTPPSLPSSDVICTRLIGWINDGHRNVLRMPGMINLRQGTLQFASVTGQPRYGLPAAFERIDRIVDATNQRLLQNRTRDWYRVMDPGELSQGNAWIWIDEGYMPVFAQPATTGKPLYAVSTSASDIAQVVSAIGIRANGDEQVQSQATVTGTTPVQIGTISDYVRVLRLDMSAVAVGTVTIVDAASSGNVLARIPIGATSVNYKCIRLWPTPVGTVTYNVDGQFLIPDLVNANDTPMLPDSYGNVLAAYARWKEYKKRDNEARATDELAEFDAQVGQLQSYVSFPPDYFPIAGWLREEAWRWNNIGGNFPPDGWGR